LLAYLTGAVKRGKIGVKIGPKIHHFSLLAVSRLMFSLYFIPIFNIIMRLRINGNVYEIEKRGELDLILSYNEMKRLADAMEEELCSDTNSRLQRYIFSLPDFIDKKKPPTDKL
jgi:hypothetical protein